MLMLPASSFPGTISSSTRWHELLYRPRILHLHSNDNGHCNAFQFWFVHELRGVLMVEYNIDNAVELNTDILSRNFLAKNNDPEDPEGLRYIHD